VSSEIHDIIFSVDFVWCCSGVAAGVESMTKDAFKWSGSMDPKVMANKSARNCLLPMGLTSENVAAKYKVTREQQDQLAVASHQKAGAAIKAGMNNKLEYFRIIFGDVFHVVNLFFYRVTSPSFYSVRHLSISRGKQDARQKLETIKIFFLIISSHFSFSLTLLISPNAYQYQASSRRRSCR
jgi:hypothetical protein